VIKIWQVYVEIGSRKLRRQVFIVKDFFLAKFFSETGRDLGDEFTSFAGIRKGDRETPRSAGGISFKAISGPSRF
jgi:hypothetical protein